MSQILLETELINNHIKEHGVIWCKPYLKVPYEKHGIPAGFCKGRNSQVNFNITKPMGFKTSSVYGQGQYRTRDINNHISKFTKRED